MPVLSISRVKIFLFCVAVSYGTCISPALAALSDIPEVTTIAGSGHTGFKDGPAMSAEFISPAGLAYDRRGNLYIADQGSHRIRVLSPRGIVTTLAGGGPLIALGLGVKGEYVDGPAKQARFSLPEAVAVNASGDVFVADTANHAIRKISNGMVTTYAGGPSKVGGNDGPREAMTFGSPRSLAFDSEGNLYIADFPNGIRKITPAGEGTTLSTGFAHAKDVSTIAIVHDGHDYLFSSALTQVQIFDLTSGGIDEDLNINYSFDAIPVTEGLNFAGPPVSIAPFNSDEWVAVDTLDSTIEFHQSIFDFLRFLSAPPLREAGANGGGYRDGKANTALFDQPLAAVIAPDHNSIIVSDTGNKRLRKIAAFDHRSGSLACCAKKPRYQVLPTSPNRSEYRIALAGNSTVWDDVTYSQSIGGQIEKALNADPEFERLHRTARVFPVRNNGVGGTELLNYADQVLSTGIFDQVIVAFSLYAGHHDGIDGGLYSSKLTRQLVGIQRALKLEGDGLIAVPYLPSSAFPNGSMYLRIPKRSGPSGDQLIPYMPAIDQEYNAMMARVKAAKVPYVDMGLLFAQQEISPQRRRVWGAWDEHLTPYGNKFFADAISRFIIQSKPWRKN